jgi:pSer/pThr/pTyr-binding forkhead associated (FHA) protein
MPEQLLTVLKVCLLVLLYLFFLRVLRAVWAEVSPPRVAADVAPARAAPAKAPKSARPRTARAPRKGAVPTRLHVLEPVDRAGTEFALTGDMTMGRAPGCTVVLDEQYVSQVHTRVFQRESGVFVEDLGSTNGTWVNGVRAQGHVSVRPGDRIQLGNVVLELR